MIPKQYCYSSCYSSTDVGDTEAGIYEEVTSSVNHHQNSSVEALQQLSKLVKPLSAAKRGLVFKRQVNRCCVAVEFLQVIEISLFGKKDVDNYITWKQTKTSNKIVWYYQHKE